MSVDEILEKYPNNLPVKEAAILLGKTPTFVHCALQANKFEWGTAVKMTKEFSYHISTRGLLKYLGMI